MRWIPGKINPIFRTKSTVLLISVSQSVDMHPSPQINKCRGGRTWPLCGPSPHAITVCCNHLHKVYPKQDQFQVFCTASFSQMQSRLFIFQKATLCKRLEQSLRPCECYFKAFMQFLNAYFSNKPSDTVTSLPNQGPYPKSLEVWEASCLTTVGVAPCPWRFWGFSSQVTMTASKHDLFPWILHFLSQWKVLHVLFQCGRPPPPCYFCTWNF